MSGNRLQAVVPPLEEEPDHNPALFNLTVELDYFVELNSDLPLNIQIFVQIQVAAEVQQESHHLNQVGRNVK